MTGTPLQNKYDELWCILDWANPGSLDSLGAFSHRYSKPIERGNRFDATKMELATARDLQRRLEAYRESRVLRRTKEKTLAEELPKKTDQIVYCQPSAFQKSIFAALIASAEMQ